MSHWSPRLQVLAWVCWLGACGTPASSGNEADAVATGDASADGSVSGADTSGDAQTADGSDAKSLLTPRSLQFSDDLLGVWGSDSDDVWLVGKGGRLLHWNGATLTPRNAGTSKDLRAVWGSGHDEAWAVGDGVILHWNGVAWSDETPEGAGVLRGVHVSPDGASVFACGDGGSVWRRGAQGKWQAETTGSKLNLQALWATGANQAWAVGEQGRALRLSGGTWTETDMPGASSRTVRAIAGATDGRLYACGDGGYLAATDETATWQQMLANDGENPRDLRGLWARTANEAWALGNDGALLHLLGKKWQVDVVSGTYMKTADFLGAFGALDATGQPYAFAVGSQGAGVRFQPGDAGASDPVAQEDRWLDFRAETVADLVSVQRGDDGSLLACGSHGVALGAQSAQAAFYDLAAPATGADIADCTPWQGAAWLVGPSGVVLHGGTAGAGWQIDAISGTKHINGLARHGDGLLAVGDSGVVLRRTVNSGWTQETTGVQFALRSVASGSTPDGQASVAYAVGELGTILRRDASGVWQQEKAGSLGQFARVIAWTDSQAAAVTEEGALWVRGAGVSGSWQLMSETPGQLLYGIARRADGLLIAVGYAGTLVVGQPTGPFQVLPKNVPNLLRGVACGDDGCVIVGQKGGIFQLAEDLP